MDFDINDRLPKLPSNARWGAAFNYKPSEHEINALLKSAPWKDDGKWHSVYDFDDEQIIDGHIIRKDKDVRKLT